ncbi:Nramp family divalent metal transporter [Peribacillus simplex]|uniref:Nramp family divalent metal transporter n=1 Tax=Peribacillus simplex TaxID=1478 RepID=UPI00333CABC5
MELKRQEIIADQPAKKMTFMQTIKSFGPGIIVALSALGAGDLVDSSVAGSHFGYALMWVLILASLVRFVIVNIMARIDMCNVEGKTLLQGYQSISKWYPYFFFGFAIVLGHIINSYMIKGAGESLTNLLGFGNPLLWAIIAAVSSLFVAGGNVYKRLEIVEKGLLGLMTLTFLIIAIAVKPDVGAIAAGTVGFELPPGAGMFGALTIVLALVGSVAGSLTNFLYPHAMRDKGWNGPAFKKLQRNDLLFGVFIIIFINLSVWIVGAQLLKPQGIEVKNISDIANALETVMGPAGFVLFYLGTLGVLYSSIIGIGSGFAKVAVENFQLFNSGRSKKYGKDFAKDPLYKWLVIWFVISPIIWSVEGAPGFVVLTIFGNAIQAVALPAISIALIIMSNNKKLMGKYTNNIFENIVLIGATLLAIWGSIQLIIGII